MLRLCQEFPRGDDPDWPCDVRAGGFQRITTHFLTSDKTTLRFDTYPHETELELGQKSIKPELRHRELLPPLAIVGVGYPGIWPIFRPISYFWPEFVVGDKLSAGRTPYLLRADCRQIGKYAVVLSFDVFPVMQH